MVISDSSATKLADANTKARIGLHVIDGRRTGKSLAFEPYSSSPPLKGLRSVWLFTAYCGCFTSRALHRKSNRAPKSLGEIVRPEARPSKNEELA
jgi:hypothetical protein